MRPEPSETVLQSPVPDVVLLYSHETARHFFALPSPAVASALSSRAAHLPERSMSQMPFHRVTVLLRLQPSPAKMRFWRCFDPFRARP